MSIARSAGPATTPPTPRGLRWLGRIGLLVGAAGVAYLFATAFDDPAHAAEPTLSTSIVSVPLTTATGTSGDPTSTSLHDVLSTVLGSATPDSAADDTPAVTLPAPPPPTAPPAAVQPAPLPAPPVAPAPPAGSTGQSPAGSTGSTGSAGSSQGADTDAVDSLSGTAVDPAIGLVDQVLTPLPAGIGPTGRTIIDLVDTTVDTVGTAVGTVETLPSALLPGLELPGLELPGIELPGTELPGLPLPAPSPTQPPTAPAPTDPSTAPDPGPAPDGAVPAGLTGPVAPAPWSPDSGPTGGAGGPHLNSSGGTDRPLPAPAPAPATPTAPATSLGAARGDSAGGATHGPAGSDRAGWHLDIAAAPGGPGYDQHGIGRLPATRQVPG